MKNPFMLIYLSFFISAFSQTQNSVDILQAFKNSYINEYKMDYSNSIANLQKVYKSDNYEINLRLGWLFLNMQNYVKSTEFYEKAIILKPLSIEAKLAYINVLNILQKYDKVYEQYGYILKIDPYNFTANYWIGFSYYYSKRYDNAAKYFELLVNLYPFNYDANNMLAWSYFNLGRFNEAKVLFNKALLSNPTSPFALDGLLRCK